MKGQMRQGLFPFLVLQTKECGLHLICGDAALSLHPCHFKLLINRSAKKNSHFLGVICRLVPTARGQRRGQIYLSAYIVTYTIHFISMHNDMYKLKFEFFIIYVLKFHQFCVYLHSMF